MLEVRLAMGSLTVFHCRTYLIDYFLFMNCYFEVGAPVYFVTTGGYNFSSEEGMNAICSSAGCNNFSLTQKIQYATDFPDM